MSPSKMILSDLINYRKEQKIGVKEMGRLLDKDETYWYYIENERIKLSLDVLFQALKIFKVNPAEFFIKCFNYDNGLVEKVNMLSEKDKLFVNDFVDKLLLK